MKKGDHNLISGTENIESASLLCQIVHLRPLLILLHASGYEE